MDWIPAGMLIVAVLGGVIAIVRSVLKIERTATTTAATLTAEIKHLSASIDELKNVVAKVDEVTDGHAQRLSVIETDLRQIKHIQDLRRSS